jgi:hypothetical protein
MRSIILMFRQVLVLVLILVIGFTSFVAPASASEEYFPEEHPVKEFIKDTVRETMKTSIMFLVPPAICLGADAIASGFFPPAAALAPYCAALTVPAGTGMVVSEGANLVKQTLSH